MNAMTLIHALDERGIELTLDLAAGRVNARPASKLTDEDRVNIRHHLPTIKRLLSVDYTDRPDGWQHDEGMPERVILVNKGALTDSCLFRTEAGAKAFMSLLHSFTAAQAFRAAAAIEDGTHDLPASVATLART